MHGIRSRWFGDWLQQDFCWGPAESALRFPSADEAAAFAVREHVLLYVIENL